MADVRAKLKRLIQEKTRPDGTPYSLDEIAAFTRVSSSTIRHLLTMESTNPTMDTIGGLAKFFGVSPAYFFEEGAQDEVGIEDQAVAIHLRGGQNLSPRDKRILEEIVKLAEQLASGRAGDGSAQRSQREEPGEDS